MLVFVHRQFCIIASVRGMSFKRKCRMANSDEPKRVKKSDGSHRQVKVVLTVKRHIFRQGDRGEAVVDAWREVPEDLYVLFVGARVMSHGRIQRPAADAA